MHKGRFEAFTDAVIAIILTIMVLDLRPPHETTWDALGKLGPVFLAYTLSFVFLGIYWSNHHHMLQSVQRVNGAVLWSNLVMLFWLSLIPFATAWMGQTGFSGTPVLLYGVLLLLCAISYYIECLTLIACNGRDSAVAKALGRDFKGKISIVIYALGIASAKFSPMAAFFFYLTVAIIWLVPDRRFERQHREAKPD